MNLNLQVVREFKNPRTPEQIKRCEEKIAELARRGDLPLDDLYSEYNRWCDEEGIQ
jgi:hypothetical protein